MSFLLFNVSTVTGLSFEGGGGKGLNILGSGEF